MTPVLPTFGVRTLEAVQLYVRALPVSSPGQPGLEGSRAAERSPQPVHRVEGCGGRVEASKRRLGAGLTVPDFQGGSRRGLPRLALLRGLADAATRPGQVACGDQH